MIDQPKLYAKLKHSVKGVLVMPNQEKESKEWTPPLWGMILVGVILAFFVFGYFLQ